MENLGIKIDPIPANQYLVINQTKINHAKIAWHAT